MEQLRSLRKHKSASQLTQPNLGRFLVPLFWHSLNLLLSGIMWGIWSWITAGAAVFLFFFIGSSGGSLLPRSVSTGKIMSHLPSEIHLHHFGIQIERLVIQASMNHSCVSEAIEHVSTCTCFGIDYQQYDLSWSAGFTHRPKTCRNPQNLRNCNRCLVRGTFLWSVCQYFTHWLSPVWNAMHHALLRVHPLHWSSPRPKAGVQALIRTCKI